MKWWVLIDRKGGQCRLIYYFIDLFIDFSCYSQGWVGFICSFIAALWSLLWSYCRTRSCSTVTDPTITLWYAESNYKLNKSIKKKQKKKNLKFNDYSNMQIFFIISVVVCTFTYNWVDKSQWNWSDSDYSDDFDCTGSCKSIEWLMPVSVKAALILSRLIPMKMSGAQHRAIQSRNIYIK